MIETLSVAFQTGELAFANGLPLRKAIQDDLATFQLTTTAAGNQIITQGRTSAGHGDLGISLAIGAFASKYLTPRTIGLHQLRGAYGE